MRKALLDEGVPRGLAQALRDRGLPATAFPNEWKQLSDRDLLDRAEAEGYDLLITNDKNLPFQQPVAGHRLSILVLASADRRLIGATADAISRIVTALLPARAFLLERDGRLIADFGSSPPAPRAS